MITLSADEFKKKYGQEGLTQVNDVSNQSSGPGYFSRVGQSYKEAGQNIVQDVTRPAESMSKGASPLEVGKEVAESGLRTIGHVAKAALAPIMELPGIKQGTEYVGNKIAEASQKPENKDTLFNKYLGWSQKHPEAAKDINAILDIAGLFGGGEAEKVAKEGATKGAQTIAETATEATAKATQGAANLAETGIKAAKYTPADIMTRVARLTPKEELAFQQTAGKSLGQYLVDTGNFGDPQEIIAKEAEKFAQSKAMVDAEMAKLPGRFRVGAVDDALGELIKKSGRVSSESVSSGFGSRARELLAISKDRGLTMEEINEAKRLLEREVKVGYRKDLNPDMVQKATNIDSAIRDWQFKKAADLGFENLPEMNRQTQISKFIINKLGNSIVGKAALNNITLTDWIILAGGDPSAVGGFLTKKFLSSKSVQAKIAQMLNKGEVQGITEPLITKTNVPHNIPVKDLGIPEEVKIPRATSGRESALDLRNLPKNALRIVRKRRLGKLLKDIEQP